MQQYCVNFYGYGNKYRPRILFRNLLPQSFITKLLHADQLNHLTALEAVDSLPPAHILQNIVLLKFWKGGMLS